MAAMAPIKNLRPCCKPAWQHSTTYICSVHVCARKPNVKDCSTPSKSSFYPTRDMGCPACGENTSPESNGFLILPTPPVVYPRAPGWSIPTNDGGENYFTVGKGYCIREK